jgi:hypothetical protein
MLESLVKQPSPYTELSIRASSYLVRDHGRQELCRRLFDVAKGSKHEELRGLSLSALFDIDPALLRDLPLELDRSRQLQTAVWSALVRLALAEGSRERLMSEPRYRRLQLGWPD